MKTTVNQKDPFLAPLLLAVVAPVLLVGCLPLQQFSVERVPGKADSGTGGQFDGLQKELATAASSNQTLRVLIVHGMGVSSPGYSTNLVDRIATKLNLKLVTDSVTNWQNQDLSVLSTRQFHNGQSNLCVYELTWSPITTPIKTNQFALDLESSTIADRQIVNNNFKTNLLDFCLSDVVLYIGQFRANLQQPIITTIRRMEQDSATNDDPIAIITHSLGSYMLIDSLQAMASANTRSAATERLSGLENSDAEKATNYAYRVKQIFMLANQIPILDLSERSTHPSNEIGHFANFFALHEGGRKKHRGNPSPHLQIVAFSDPNDLLSYRLRKHDLKEKTEHETETGSKANGFNVNYTVAKWSIVGVFAWPASAHENWWTDSRVPELLVHGHRTTKLPQQGKAGLMP